MRGIALIGSCSSLTQGEQFSRKRDCKRVDYRQVAIEGSWIGRTQRQEPLRDCFAAIEIWKSVRSMHLQLKHDPEKSAIVQKKVSVRFQAGFFLGLDNRFELEELGGQILRRPQSVQNQHKDY